MRLRRVSKPSGWGSSLRRIPRYKRWWYKRGHRPRPGTVLYSPSLSLIYGFRDAEKRFTEFGHPDYPSDCRDSPR